MNLLDDTSSDMKRVDFFRVRSCPVCGVDARRELLRQEWCLFEDHPLAVPIYPDIKDSLSVYGIDCCEECGAVYNSPICDAEAYNCYYAEWSRYANGTDPLGGLPDPITLGRFQETVKLVAPYLSSSEARILDVGSLDGGLLKEFRSHGYSELTGVDPSLENCRRAALDGIDVYQGTVSAIPSPDSSFDMVLCVHILEHVAELKKLDVFRVLAPGGYLYIEVPDATAYKPGSRDLFSDLSLEHINHFGLKTLSNLLISYGFREVVSGYRIYPCSEYSSGIQASIYGIFEKNLLPKLTLPEMDFETSTAITNYIAESMRLSAALEHRLEEFVLRSGKIRLWGTGQVAFRLLGLSSLRKASITSITDSNPLYWGKCLHGIEVVPPDLFMTTDEPILIASGLHGKAISSTLFNFFQWDGEIFIP